MLFLKIVENQSLNFETYIKLKNKSSQLIFACENSLLLNYYEYSSPLPANTDAIFTLGHLFSHELVKFFNTKIPGGLFEVVEVASFSKFDQSLNFVDVSLEENSSNQSIYYARLYGTPLVVESVNKHIIDKSVLTQINKVTGYPTLTNQLKIDELYETNLLENIRTLQSREFLLKCSYLIEDNTVDFYFPEKMVRHFCSLVIKNSNPKSLPFNATLGKLFAELFLNYLNEGVHVFAKTLAHELGYVKGKDFLEFNLLSNTNQFEFFSESKNKAFFLKLLTALNFKNKQKSLEKPSLGHLDLPFPVEIGVTYLNQSEYKNLTEGDIIVFDKTCVTAEMTNVDKCVINLNGLYLIASLNNDTCQVTHFTKDW